jgi:hypothetical protein
MVTFSSHFKKITAALAAIALGAAMFPAIASAQAVPPYATEQGGEIQGTISSINGTWNISVADANGYTDNVELHQGTIINPTGLTLAPGMQVSILGYANGGEFDANEIDTPYHYAGPAPVPVYYGPGWWYPGFAYGYGPSFSLVIGAGPILIRHPWGGVWYSRAPVLGFRVGFGTPGFRAGVSVNTPGFHAYVGTASGYRAPAPAAWGHPGAPAAWHGPAPGRAPQAWGHAAPQRAPQSHYAAHNNGNNHWRG